MFDLTTCEDTPNATSSPASADGLTPCGSPDGPIVGLSGQGLALVSHFQAPAVAAGHASGLKDISGPPGASLSLQIALERSLVSRLPKPPTGIPSSAMT